MSRKLIVMILALLLAAPLVFAGNGSQGVQFGSPFNQETYLFPIELVTPNPPAEPYYHFVIPPSAAGKLEYNRTTSFCYSFKAINEDYTAGPELDMTGGTEYALVFSESEEDTIVYVLGLTKLKQFKNGKFGGKTFLVTEGCCSAIVGPVFKARSLIRLVTVSSLEANTDFDPNTFEEGNCTGVFF